MKYVIKRRLILGISLFCLFIIYLLRNSSFSLRMIGLIIGFWIFYFIDHAFDLDFLPIHYIYISLILIASFPFAQLYYISESYDKILHFVFPIIGSVMLFYVVNKQKISFKWKLLTTLALMVSILAIHEIGEYLLDLIWDLKLQGVYLRDFSGIQKYNLIMPKNDDTMIDLILGLIGSLTFVAGNSISNFYSNKKSKK